MTQFEDNPYEYRLTYPTVKGAINADDVEYMANDLYDKGWEFIGFMHGQLLSRRIRDS